MGTPGFLPQMTEPETTRGCRGRKCSADHQATEEQGPCRACEDVPLMPCPPPGQPGPAQHRGLGCSRGNGVGWKEGLPRRVGVD